MKTSDEITAKIFLVDGAKYTATLGNVYEQVRAAVDELLKRGYSEKDAFIEGDSILYSELLLRNLFR